MLEMETRQINESNLTPEQHHQRAGEAFGEEYYRRISNPETNSFLQSYYPSYVAEDLRRMTPTLYEIFMSSAENRFQVCAAEDLRKQGIPENLALQKAFTIGRAFRIFATVLYENNLGVGRSPEGDFPPPAYKT
jgi:hypothetical protein